MLRPLFILLAISVISVVVYTVFLQTEKNRKSPFMYSENYGVFDGCDDICEGTKKELYCTQEYGYKTCYGECSVPVYNSCDQK